MKFYFLLSLIFGISIESVFAVVNGFHVTHPEDPAFQSSVMLEIHSKKMNVSSAPHTPEADCTGTLISDQHILTAAHCIQTFGFAEGLAYFGNEPSKKSKPIQRNIFRAEALPSYQKHREAKNDVAILFFSGGIPKGYKPAQIIALQKEKWIGKTVRLAGFGKPSAKKSSGSLKKMGITITSPQTKENNIFFGKNFWKPASAICFGDSGGPWYLQSKNDLMQVFAVQSSLLYTEEYPDNCLPGQYAKGADLSRPEIKNFIYEVTGISY